MPTHLNTGATSTRGANMTLEAQGAAQTMRRTGWILSGIVITFIAADAIRGFAYPTPPLCSGSYFWTFFGRV